MNKGTLTLLKAYGTLGIDKVINMCVQQRGATKADVLEVFNAITEHESNDALFKKKLTTLLARIKHLPLGNVRPFAKEVADDFIDEILGMSDDSRSLGDSDIFWDTFDDFWLPLNRAEPKIYAALVAAVNARINRSRGVIVFDNF